MIDRSDISNLLALHRNSYELLLLLSENAKLDPKHLSVEIVEKLKKKTSCESWLRENKESIPIHLRPQVEEWPMFAGLLSSYFHTSFGVAHLTFEGRLMDANVVVGNHRRNGNRGVRAVKALAFKHLCGSVKISLTDAQARQLCKNHSIQEALTIWTYVWELDRRSKGKAKGRVNHTLWRSMPFETRKKITVELVWRCREQLLASAQEVMG